MASWPEELWPRTNSSLMCWRHVTWGPSFFRFRGSKGCRKLEQEDNGKWKELSMETQLMEEGLKGSEGKLELTENSSEHQPGN